MMTEKQHSRSNGQDTITTGRPPARTVGGRHGAPRLVVFMIILSALCFPCLSQVTGTDLPSYDMSHLQRLFQASTALYHSRNQAESIHGFSEIIEAIRGGRTMEGLDGAERSLLLSSFELRAQAFFNDGDFDAARRDFHQLLSIEPGHQLDPSLVSPKILRLYEEERDVFIGTLLITAEPAGSQVFVDGSPAGLTDGAPIHVFSGPRLVEVKRPGHQLYRDTLEIAAGSRREIGPIILERTMATCKFITVPAGVEVLLNGRSIGKTSGSPSQEAREIARQAGVNPLAVSDMLLVPDIQPGVHRVEFRKSCYVGISKDLSFNQPLDYVDAIRVLEPSRGVIVVHARPPECSIYLDGSLVGTGDQVLKDLCSGEHTIEASYQGGRFRTVIQLEKDARVEIATVLRPTLLYVGRFPRLRLGSGADDAAGSREVRNGLASLESLNISFPATDDVMDIFGRHGLTESQTLPRELPARLLSELGNSFKGSLILLSATNEEGSGELRLYSTSHGKSEIMTVDEIGGGLNAAVSGLVSKLETMPPLSRPWSGLVACDVSLSEGLPVIAVADGSPAAAAGIRVGDIICAIDGRRPKTASEIRRTVAATTPGEAISFQLARAGKNLTSSLVVGTSPILVPDTDGDFFYNHLLERLKSVLRSSAPGSEEDAYTRLNIALCLLHFDLVEPAATILEPATLESNIGISNGTLAFYQALCAHRSGRIDRANRLYAQVVKSPQATLVDNDGPPAWLAAQGLLPEPLQLEDGPR